MTATSPHLAHARSEGAKAERARIAAILSLPEAKGQEAAAHALAFDSDAAPEAARKTLSMTLPTAESLARQIINA